MIPSMNPQFPGIGRSCGAGFQPAADFQFGLRLGNCSLRGHSRRPKERRLQIGAQLAKLPYKLSC
jgi:hypothetical protein